MSLISSQIDFQAESAHSHNSSFMGKVRYTEINRENLAKVESLSLETGFLITRVSNLSRGNTLITKQKLIEMLQTEVSDPKGKDNLKLAKKIVTSLGGSIFV